MTFNTGNPVGSVDPRDLYDNSENFDKLSVGTDLEYPDRLGVLRKSWAGLEQQVADFLASQGWESVFVQYAAGAVVHRPTQLIEREGELYRVALQSNLPLTLDGAWAVDAQKLVAVGNQPLRQQLSAPDGVAMVGNAVDERELGGAQGAGMVGYDPGTTYPAGSMGAALKAVPEVLPATGGNLLSRMMTSASVRGMYVRNIGTNIVAVGVGMSESLSSVVEYRFRYNGDGLILLRGGFSGVEDPSTNHPEITLSALGGQWNTNSPPRAYATTVGATFTATFTGSTLRFRTPLDNRGGVWRVSLSNGLTRDISTWSDSATITETEIVVFEQFTHGSYSVTFEFMGSDPINPPAGGTPRGWFYYAPGDPARRPLKTMPVGIIAEETAQPVLSPNSIPDVAIQARPAGETYPRVWVPLHANEDDVSMNVFGKIIIDGVSVADNAGGATGRPGALYNYREIRDFQLVQKFEARNPNGPSDTMWMHYITHTLRRDDPVVTIKNRVEVRRPTEMTAIYFGMLPAEAQYVSRLVLNNGNEIDEVPTNDADYGFGWDVTSAMYAGEYAPGNFHATACEVTSLKDSGLLGTPYAKSSPGRINHRADGVSKVYWGGGNNSVVPAGAVFRSEHRIGVVSGVRFPDEMLKSI